MIWLPSPLGNQNISPPMNTLRRSKRSGEASIRIVREIVPSLSIRGLARAEGSASRVLVPRPHSFFGRSRPLLLHQKTTSRLFSLSIPSAALSCLFRRPSPSAMPGPEHVNGSHECHHEVPLIADEPIPLSDLCARIHAGITGFLEEEPATQRLRDVQEQTKIALGVIEVALDRYSLLEISLSYNGGKDCLVLLILYLHTLHTKSLVNPSIDYFSPIQSVYIQSAHPFPEVETFVAESTKVYSLALDHYAKPMKASFAEYLQDKPSVKAIFVGTRRTDPHGGSLTHFDETDQGWPSFMRVHPVIDWHYVDVWTFIRHLHIPYCSLYDQGYTSLGGTTDTHPNPALRRSASETNGKDHPAPDFKPAHELIDDHEERLGRDRD
ncbi:adenine nucleotide alpha hydrolases-like protein [Aulographum hederae CBS 113979]|uniref:FAD synthase n=1 Tax=Aulographum hederae CBS 113979 TaxID=1176131 RepID=A0A6G1HCL6_9PEZI|nr:adenine nucleotide alpha hydrolases-like protein [Aulographum hederae CBS 113979]